MTELALIPPVPHLHDFATSGSCMLLAHLCRNPKYIEYYRQRRMLGDYLILDNSAFEKGSSVVSMPMLMAISNYMQCQEIVAPDTIMNRHETYGKSLEAIAWLDSHVGQAAWMHAGKPRIMIVPQVDPEFEQIDDYADHAADMVSAWNYGVPYLRGYITLGVSKNMDKLHGGWLMLFREVVRELVREFHLQVHCLGLPKELNRTRKVVVEHPYIRSLDTALPFVCAAANHVMTNNGTMLPKRPPEYLDLQFNEAQLILAHGNIDFLKEYFKF
ncbi:MAG TPA: hypothetical protein VH187_12245 [Scandinavium sp.]|uniref:hypothetical protein n=1 Tax=Scandinavium sp. TaxID=2830653 RepID=UPI002E335584|nr:hypothetical protein [Scandinavium sp.]HEX4501905.1 hypothetical protein [Scandinavium sp.]